MITNKKERRFVEEVNSMGGVGQLDLDILLSKLQRPESVRVFAKGSLAPGHSIGYHTHTGESETYYFLSGHGKYNDNGTEFVVGQGDVTITCSGEGHSLENTGDKILEFMILIVKDQLIN